MNTHATHKPRALLLSAVACFCLHSANAHAADDTAQTTMALTHYMELQSTIHELRKDLRQQDAHSSTSNARVSVSRIEIRGRLTHGSFVGVASIDVDCAAGGATEDRAPLWAHALLLPEDPNLHITRIPGYAPNDDIRLFSNEAGLHLLTTAQGRRTFEVGILLKGLAAGRNQWNADLVFAPATIRRVLLRHDAELFRLQQQGMRDGDDLILLPQNDKVHLSWKQVGARAAQVLAERAPIAPTVTSGHGSIVTTLDGQYIARYRYDLQLEAEERITLTIPTGVATKVFVNGASIAFQTKTTDGNTTIPIRVSPPRPGESTAHVEVVVREERPPMSLSGSLRFVLPTTSWGINHFTVELFLPDVFTYDWRGGSLSSGTHKEQPTHFSLSMPTPGHSITLSQDLVRSMPDVEVGYAVDLSGQYFE